MTLTFFSLFIAYARFLFYVIDEDVGSVTGSQEIKKIKETNFTKNQLLLKG